MNVTDLNRQNTIGGIVVDDRRNETHNTDAKSTEITKPRTSSLCSNNRSVPFDRQSNECDDDSSAVYSDSDSDFDDIVPSPISLKNNLNNQSPSYCIMKKNTNLNSAMPEQSSIMCANNNDNKLSIGSIAVQNSSDITFGNKTFYQGPVTIKQFVYDKNNKWKESELSPSAPKDDHLDSTNICTDKLSQMHMGKCESAPNEVMHFYYN